MKRTRRSMKARRGRLIPIPLTLLVAVVGFGFFLNFRLCGQCEDLGRMLAAAEQEHVELQRRFQNESYQWANICAPDNLERALRKHGLTMAWPTRDYIIRLYDVRADRSYSVVGLRGGG